jgi:hypothetical protein
MELKRKSWYAWLYKRTYGTELPDNLCPFFWKMILAIVMFPVTWPCIVIELLILDDPSKTRWSGRLFYGFATNVLSIIVCASIMAHYTKHIFYWWTSIVGFIITIIGVASILAVIGGLVWLGDTIRLGIVSFFRKKKKTVPKQSILSEYVKARFGKYCPKITWK